MRFVFRAKEKFRPVGTRSRNVHAVAAFTQAPPRLPEPCPPTGTPIWPVADKATVIRDISDGQYSNPVRVVAFNTAEGWSRDVTEDIAREMMDLAHRTAEPLSKPARAFVEWATGEGVPANLMDRS